MTTHRPAPGTLALTCPSCGERPVCTAQRYSIVRSYFVSAQLGSMTAVGCRACVRAAGGRALGRNAALGWWSFPWGLLVPFYILQNLFRMLMPPPGCLAEACRSSGLDIEQFRVDAQGLTPLEWDLLHVAGASRRRFADAAGIHLDEAMGVAFLIDLSEHRISPAQARQMLTNTTATSPATVPLEFRDQLLWMLGDLIPTEQAAHFIAPLRAAAQWLQCEPETLSAMLHALGKQVAAPSSGDIAALDLACATLGVRTSASRDEVHRTYKRLLLQWHPDRAIANNTSVEEATARTQSITAAYRTLMQARGWSGADAR